MKNLKQRLSYLLVADESVENRLKKYVYCLIRKYHIITGPDFISEMETKKNLY